MLLLFEIVLLLVIPDGPIANRVPPPATMLLFAIDAELVEDRRLRVVLAVAVPLRLIVGEVVAVVLVALLLLIVIAGFDATFGEGIDDDETVGLSVPLLPFTNVVPFAIGSGPLFTITVDPVFVAPPPAPAAN